MLLLTCICLNRVSISKYIADYLNMPFANKLNMTLPVAASNTVINKPDFFITGAP